MRTAAAVLVFVALGLMFAGAWTLVIFVAIAALSLDLLAETFE